MWGTKTIQTRANLTLISIVSPEFIGRRGFVISALAMGALVASGCSQLDSKPYHYKLTVEVETPQGVRSGSSVIKVLMTSPIKGAEALGGSGPSARGEAVAVELPNGKTLFVLLRSEGDVDWAGGAHIKSSGLKQEDFPNKARFRESLRNSRLVYPVQRWAEGPGGKKIDNYPMMVMFEDINDPKTVKRVVPDDLAPSFGAGYKLKVITASGTGEAPNTRIKERFSWWNKYKDRHFDGSSTISEDMRNNSLSAHLSSGSFSTELNK